MLCYDSNPNCVGALYDDEAGICTIKIHEELSGELPSSHYCPNGMFDSGHLRESVEMWNWENWILGPCVQRAHCQHHASGCYDNEPQ